MTQKEWNQLSDLLVKAADQTLPTWQEKKRELIEQLSGSGLTALTEIASWFDG